MTPDGAQAQPADELVALIAECKRLTDALSDSARTDGLAYKATGIDWSSRTAKLEDDILAAIDRLGNLAAAPPAVVPAEPVMWRQPGNWLAYEAEQKALWARGDAGERAEAAKLTEPLYATPPVAAAPVVPAGWKLVPVEPTPEMVAAYLTANDDYWRRTDELPRQPNKWRNGTPSEATAEGYRAMLVAAPPAATPASAA